MGNCDVLGYEVEEKTFIDIPNACQKIVRTYTITNWCQYEIGGSPILINRQEDLYGFVKEEQTINVVDLVAEMDNKKIGQLQYIQILKWQAEIMPEDSASIFATIIGNIKDWKAQGIEQVQIDVLGFNSTTSNVNGAYELELNKNNNYTIQPTKNINPLNGVSTYDLLLIAKHILGLQPFENPYQYLAADVNQSGTITSYDLVQLRRLILAIDNNFTNNTSWRFINKDFEVDKDNILLANLPGVINILDLQEDKLLGFTGVKIGDVNPDSYRDAIPNSLALTEERNSSKTFKLNLTDKYLKAGQSYSIPFFSSQITAIEGFQFSLNFSGLKLNALNTGLLNEQHFGKKYLAKNILTVSWHQAELPTTPSQLFKLTFIPDKNGYLSEFLQLNNQPTPIEAYHQNGTLLPIELMFKKAEKATFELYQNEPNPFKNTTQIGFYLPEKSNVRLIIRTETGQLLKTIETIKEAGHQSIDLNNMELPKGLLFYQLHTKFGTETKKMIHLK